jgi:hypothetical protein
VVAAGEAAAVALFGADAGAGAAGALAAVAGAADVAPTAAVLPAEADFFTPP